MNKPTNNELKDLLAKQHQNLDNFEQEAMEGFDSLSSEQEALDLKSELDKEINEKLFLKEENKKRGWIWLAAASLLLTLGLGIFFVKSDLFNSTEKQNLALNTETDKEEKSNTPNQLIDNKQGETQLNEQVAIEKKKESDLGNSARSKNNFPPQEEKISVDADLKKEAAATSADEDKEVEGAKSNLDVLTNTGVNNFGSTSANAAATSKDQKIVLADKAEPSKKDFKSAGLTEVGDKKLEEKAKPSENQSLTDNEKLNGSNISVVNSSPIKIVASPKNKKTTTSPGAPTSNSSVKNDANAKPTEDIIEVSNENKNSPQINEIACEYIGGEDKLNKDLKLELVKLDLDKAFKAKLKLDENLKVSEVIFIEGTNFSKKELNKVKLILLSLGNFKKPINPVNAPFYNYLVNYTN